MFRNAVKLFFFAYCHALKTMVGVIEGKIIV